MIQILIVAAITICVTIIKNKMLKKNRAYDQQLRSSTKRILLKKFHDILWNFLILVIMMNFVYASLYSWINLFAPPTTSFNGKINLALSIFSIIFQILFIFHVYCLLTPPNS